MTTIVATRTWIAADRKIACDLVFKSTKLFRVNGSIIGVAGSFQHALKFIEWRKNLDNKPTMGEDDFEALELTANGKLFLWQSELIAMPIDGDCYAIGSGGGIALGALEMGASPKKAIALAAKYDNKTGSAAQIMRLKGAK
jgi:hypothetical protein